MREQRAGSIINIGALNVEHSPVGVFEAPAYYIAKSGVIMLTRSLARSEAPWGIRVNAVNPGFIETETYGGYQAEDKAAWARMVPLGRLGTPGDIADAVSYLASERARYVTGTILHVHGGLWV
jgi:3-oxoacyl-[acyl-carrier protein] reductase